MKMKMKNVKLKRFETLEEIKNFLNERDEENGIEPGEGEDKDTEIILFDSPSFASAFIGITQDRRAVYDYSLMIQDFSGKDPKGTNLSEKAIQTLIEAQEFIDYNISDNSTRKEYPIIINLN